MGKFLAGALFGIVIVALGTYLFLRSGRAPVAASAPADWIDSVAPWVFDRALAKQTAGSTVSIPKDPAAVARGLSHYKENCLPCHGAPGVKEAEFSQGLNPMPPGMDSPPVQESSDAELFWVVKNGIRMTGMPAFNRNHSDSEIADILAFVRHIRSLDAAEKEKLRAGAAEDHHHDEAGEHHEH